MKRLAPLLVMLLCVGAVWRAEAGRLTLDRPGDREFIRDLAELLPPGEARQLQQRCDTLLDDTNVPIFVVTIDSMAGHGGGGMTIESFARTLFDDWGDTHPLVHGQDWTNGILLVISLQDRAARIELGRAWAGSKDSAARRIMDEHLLPAFRAGDFAAGIVAGVNALDKMARGEAVPAAPTPLNVYLFWTVLAGLAVFTGVSLIRRGRSGWAWVFWAAIFALLGVLLHQLSKNVSVHRGDYPSGPSGNSFEGGSWGGGSSGGGGFSGGGGASGSW